MNECRITKYWSHYFGISTEDMNAPGISVLPHTSLEGYKGAWIFKRNNRIIFSVRPTDIEPLRTKINIHPPNQQTLFSDSYLHELFTDNIDRIIGPTFQGYYDTERIPSKPSNKVTQIRLEDHKPEITALSQTGDPEGWKHSGIPQDNESMVGLWMENVIVSIAQYKIITGDVGFIGVYTDPKHRGNGYGQQVVQAIVNDVAQKGKLVRYQTLMSNVSSTRIAEKAGIVEFGRSIAIRLKV